MQDVTITFTSGPMRDRKLEFEVGHVLIGRLPGAGGLELKGADTSVSRTHAELVEVDGDIELRNLSPNGTKVDGKLIIDAVRLKPGAKLAVGNAHAFEITWTSFQSESTVVSGEKDSKADKSKGPLSSPIVRAVIGVYLLGIIVVAIWLGVLAGGDDIAADDWPGLEAAYLAYESSGLSEDERDQRLARAETLVRDLRALRTQGTYQGRDRICRELMRIDRDSQSPLYRYGAHCLASQ
jgi:hypothetical protein